MTVLHYRVTLALLSIFLHYIQVSQCGETLFNTNKCTKATFKLLHVIPAKEALQVQRSGDEVKRSLLMETPLLGLFESVEEEGEEIRIQTKEEFIFDFSSSKSLEQAESFKEYFETLPSFLPKPEDHETILSFAKMAANSYVARNMDGWRNSTDYSDDDGFGWNATGLRGHVFATPDREIVVISFKGTSTILGGGETVARDKYMDNMMFSCCCARVDISWTPICGCYKGSKAGQSVCDATCLEGTARSDPDSYYYEALAVTQLVIARYPRSHIWFTGHSLGGAIAALMAVAVRRTAAITFASPGPLLYSKRMGLHLGLREGDQWKYPIWNFGISTDPIFMGTCTGLTKSCYLSGYAMETSCRHGADCLFQVSSWQPDVSTHRIDWFIDNVLDKPDKYPVPICLPNTNCTDCSKWTFEHIDL